MRWQTQALEGDRSFDYGRLVSSINFALDPGSVRSSRAGLLVCRIWVNRRIGYGGLRIFFKQQQNSNQLLQRQQARQCPTLEARSQQPAGCGGRTASSRSAQTRATGGQDMALDYCRLGACGGPWTPLLLQQTWHR